MAGATVATRQESSMAVKKTAKVAAKKTTEEKVGPNKIVVSAIDMRVVRFRVKGISMLVQQKFWKKAEVMAQQEKGSTAKTKKNRVARDFQADFLKSAHKSKEGWYGVPAAAFRNACIDACRMVGFKMTEAKMSIFVEADGYDSDDGQPLVRLIAGEPHRLDSAVRNSNKSIDIRARPAWHEWAFDLRIRYDAGQFTETDIANLVERAGQQVGIGEGRPFSKVSAGLGYGLFTIKGK